MAISQEQAQDLSTKTEWDTLSNTFSPRLDELTPAVVKKHANRIKRFLEKEKTAPTGDGKAALFEEALARLEARRSDEGDNEKLAARREKEKAAADRAKEVRDKRSEVKTKLKEKADKEKAEKEAADGGSDDKKANSTSTRSRLQDAGRHNQGKIGSRKV